jgi:hypothetical protein
MAVPMKGPGVQHIGMDENGNANVTVETLGTDPGAFPSVPLVMDGPGCDDLAMSETDNY